MKLFYLGRFGIALALLLENGLSGSAQKPVGKSAKQHNEAGQGGIVYGEDWSFLIEAPKGWVMDTSLPAESKVNVAFYPLKQTWKDAKSVIYVHVTGDSLKETLKYDLEQFREHHPKLTVRPVTVPPLKGNPKTESRIFEGVDLNDQGKEWVTYVQTPEHVMIIVLSSRNQEAFAKAKNDYLTLLKNFVPMHLTKETKKREKK